MPLDFSCYEALRENVRYIHRRLPDGADVYFVANRRNAAGRRRLHVPRRRQTTRILVARDGTNRTGGRLRARGRSDASPLAPGSRRIGLRRLPARGNRDARSGCLDDPRRSTSFAEKMAMAAKDRRAQGRLRAARRPRAHPRTSKPSCKGFSTRAAPAFRSPDGRRRRPGHQRRQDADADYHSSTASRSTSAGKTRKRSTLDADGPRHAVDADGPPRVVDLRRDASGRLWLEAWRNGPLRAENRVGQDAARATWATFPPAAGDRRPVAVAVPARPGGAAAGRSRQARLLERASATAA